MKTVIFQVKVHPDYIQVCLNSGQPIKKWYDYDTDWWNSFTYKDELYDIHILLEEKWKISIYPVTIEKAEEHKSADYNHPQIVHVEVDDSFYGKAKRKIKIIESLCNDVLNRLDEKKPCAYHIIDEETGLVLLESIADILEDFKGTFQD